MAKKIRCLRVYVYRWGLGDCTNHGYTEKNDAIYVPCPRGPDMIDEDDPALFKVKKSDFSNYKCLVPYNPCPPNTVGWMDGGNVAYTSDSRFREFINEFPLMIHDRCETREQNDILSR